MVEVFYHILHKNSIGHLLRTSHDSFRPPPKSFRKEMDNILLYFYVHFRVVFVVFCRNLSKIWPKNLIFTFTAIILERGLFIGLFLASPPLSHQEVIDAI